MLLATTSGRNGTAGSRASAARTPISCASWSAAGRDQANFTKNRSPTGTLPECHSGSCLPAGPGTVTGYPLSSGATTRRASASATAEHSASHVIPGPRPRPDSRAPASGRQATLRAARHGYSIRLRAGACEAGSARLPHPFGCLPRTPITVRLSRRGPSSRYSGCLLMRPSGQLPGVDGVADRGVLADAEDLGQVQRGEPGGHGFGELAVDPQPFQRGGQAAQAAEQVRAVLAPARSTELQGCRTPAPPKFRDHGPAAA